MATYKSALTELNASAPAVFAKLSNLEGLRDLIDKVPADRIPEDKRGLLDNITVTSDSISMPAGPVGNLTMKVSEKKEPELIALSGVGTPIPMGLKLQITPVDDNSCKAQAVLDIELPGMLKMMVGSQLQKAADTFGDLLKSIPF